LEVEMAAVVEVWVIETSVLMTMTLGLHRVLLKNHAPQPRLWWGVKIDGDD